MGTVHEKQRGGRRIAYGLAVVLAFVLPWRQAVELPGGLSIGPPLAAVLAIVWLGTVVRNREIRRPHPFHLAFGCYAGYSALSMLWSIDPRATIGRLIVTLYILALLVIYWDLLRDRTHFETVIQALVLGVFIIALSGIATFLTGDLGGRRAVAHGVNANSLARWVTLAAPLAAYLAIVSRRYGTGAWRYLNLGYVIVTPVAVGATASRQGFVVVAALAGLAAVAAVQHRDGYRGVSRSEGGIAAVFLAAISIILVTVSPAAVVIDRLMTLPSALLTVGDRTSIWLAGIETLRANPVVGIGAGAFGEIAPLEAASDPHNTPLGVAVELGGIGLGIFLVMALLPLRAAFRRTGSALFAVAVYLSVGLFALVAMLYTDPFNWLILLFVLIDYSFDRVTVLSLNRTALSQYRKHPSP